MHPKKKIQEIYFLVNKVKAIQHYFFFIFQHLYTILHLFATDYRKFVLKNPTFCVNNLLLHRLQVCLYTGIYINRTSQGCYVTPNKLLLNELEMNWRRQHLSLYLLISQVKMLPSKPEVRRRPVLRSYSMFLTQFV